MSRNFTHIITREQAKRRRLKRYFTGEPCRHGHVCERFVKRSWCVECANKGLRPERKPPAKTYVPEKPCKRGHFERYASGGGCVECSRGVEARRLNRKRQTETQITEGVLSLKSSRARGGE